MMFSRDGHRPNAVLFLACLLGMFVYSGAVDAASRICRQLENELALSGRGVSTAQYRKYDRAVVAQREQLDLATRRARAAGCGFSFFEGQSSCGQLNVQIDKMRRNLQSLQRTRTQLAGQRDSRGARSRILAEIEANGCREAGGTRQERPPLQARTNQGSVSILDRIRGRGQPETRQRAFPDDDQLRLRDSHEGASRRILIPDGRVTIEGSGERYRTVCVRTCDGYFFPMSPASTRADFDRDQKNCESSCPGTDIRLFYHDPVDEESEAMVSANSGEPYASLSTAYLYKTNGTPRPQGCGCNPQENFSVIAGNPADDEPSAQPVIPVPDARPDPATDPETLANARGGLTADVIKRFLSPGSESTTGKTDPGQIRVVGPAFLPDPGEAIDLQAPAPTQDQ